MRAPGPRSAEHTFDSAAGHFQSVWLGAAYFWLFAITLAAHQGWLAERAWRAFALFNGFVGVGSMVGAVVLALYSRWLYLRRCGRQVARMA